MGHKLPNALSACQVKSLEKTGSYPKIDGRQTIPKPIPSRHLCADGRRRPRAEAATPSHEVHQLPTPGETGDGGRGGVIITEQVGVLKGVIGYSGIVKWTASVYGVPLGAVQTEGQGLSLAKTALRGRASFYQEFGKGNLGLCREGALYMGRWASTREDQLK